MKTPKKRTRYPDRAKTAFVVHGRNEELRRAFFDFLRAIGLNPIEWREAIEFTGKGAPFIGEILEAAFSRAVAVVVLLSPDDEAKLADVFCHPNEMESEGFLRGQPRPNVLFEAGMAFGRSPDNTVLVQVGSLRPFSDIAGRHVVHLNNATEKRQELISKLKNAGCDVSASERRSDWVKVGNFDLPSTAHAREPYRHIATIYDYRLHDKSGRKASIQTAEKVEVLREVKEGGSFWTTRPINLQYGYKYVDP